MKTLLWLDDIRNPNDDLWKTWIIENSINIKEYKIIWVKDYTEFVKWITLNNIPDIICFDHDLGDDSMQPNAKWIPTGYDCTKWLVNYCMTNKLNIPEYRIQSANPVGANNIKCLIENFKKNVKF